MLLERTKSGLVVVCVTAQLEDFLVICLIGDSPVSPVKKITFEEGSSFSLVIVDLVAMLYS